MYRVLAFLLTFLMMSCAIFKSSTEKSEPDATAEKNMLEIAENYVSDGVAFYQNKNDSLAVASWKKALEIIPEDAEVHNFMGLAYHRLNDLASAENEFSMAVKYDTSYYQAMNNLGMMQFYRGKYFTAKENFESALQINPNYNPARLNLDNTNKILRGTISRKDYELSERAEHLNDLDELEEKIDTYKLVLSLNPNFAQVHNNIGVAYFYNDQLDSAYQHLLKALTLKKDYPEALNNLGYLYKLDHRYEQAVNLFLKAIALKRDYLFALNNLGETYTDMKKYDKARKVFKKVLEMDPANGYAKQSMEKLSQLIEENGK